MPTLPTVSIVTVCKNSAATITKTIASVLEQNHTGLEYIIIDGASTDGTQDIVRSFGNSVDVFISEPDDGIADAFNKGIRRATGSIVGIINADDRLLPGVIDKVKNFFAAHPDVDVLHGDVFLSDCSQLIKKIRPAGRWWYPWRLVLFNHPATFVRRSVYEEYGLFDTNYRIAMDVEIFLRWKSRGVKMTYLTEVFVNMNCGGASGQCAEVGFRESRKALLKYGYSAILVNVQLVGRMMINKILSIGK